MCHEYFNGLCVVYLFESGAMCETPMTLNRTRTGAKLLRLILSTIDFLAVLCLREQPTLKTSLLESIGCEAGVCNRFRKASSEIFL